eukprot:223134-Chlamydomonas_euryale.AAC.6
MARSRNWTQHALGVRAAFPGAEIGPNMRSESELHGPVPNRIQHVLSRAKHEVAQLTHLPPRTHQMP